ncbi:unnamed protein product [Dibothriocephalus latus]|uniref:UBA domain-containing protein n=1 Tax=Dibothriocephalus latus TaxID=60516 RepID=A0A3P7QSZ2_DIBLA|nr:unnamed protein product [Dibothriocephalus latus]
MRINKLRTLSARTNKPENALQAAVSFLVDMGYDEDSVFNALMESNGDRDMAEKDLEWCIRQRASSEPTYPHKAAERALRIRALAARIGKSETVLQAAVPYLVNQGYDDESVIKALTESNGDKEIAEKDLEWCILQRNFSAPAFR